MVFTLSHVLMIIARLGQNTIAKTSQISQIEFDYSSTICMKTRFAGSKGNRLAWLPWIWDARTTPGEMSRLTFPSGLRQVHPRIQTWLPMLTTCPFEMLHLSLLVVGMSWNTWRIHIKLWEKYVGSQVMAKLGFRMMTVSRGKRFGESRSFNPWYSGVP